MNSEQLGSGAEREKRRSWEETVVHCHFVHHDSHLLCRGSELKSPQGEAYRCKISMLSSHISFIWDTESEFDDFQFVVLMKLVEYKEQNNRGVAAVKCQLIFAFYFLKITSSNLSPWHAAHYFNLSFFLCHDLSTISLWMERVVTAPDCTQTHTHKHTLTMTHTLARTPLDE
jgi:hypothetical protein